jgi:hypothetical protein
MRRNDGSDSICAGGRQLADHLARDTAKQLLAQRVQRLVGMLSGASRATRHREVLARDAPGFHLREQLFLLSLAQCTSQEHHTELANKHRASGWTGAASGRGGGSGSGGGFCRELRLGLELGSFHGASYT